MNFLFLTWENWRMKKTNLILEADFETFLKEDSLMIKRIANDNVIIMLSSSFFFKKEE